MINIIGEDMNNGTDKLILKSLRYLYVDTDELVTIPSYTTMVDNLDNRLSDLDVNENYTQIDEISAINKIFKRFSKRDLPQ